MSSEGVKMVSFLSASDIETMRTMVTMRTLKRNTELVKIHLKGQNTTQFIAILWTT